MAVRARTVAPGHREAPKQYIVPLGKRVLIEQDLPKEMHGSIIIPDQAQIPEGRGRVLAIGPKVTTIEVGWRVVFAKYVGLKVKLASDSPRDYELSKHVVVNEDDITLRELTE